MRPKEPIWGPETRQRLERKRVRRQEAGGRSEGKVGIRARLTAPEGKKGKKAAPEQSRGSFRGWLKRQRGSKSSI